MKYEWQIAICDDEKFFRSFIKRGVEKYMQRRGVRFHIDLFESGETLCNCGRLAKYDVFFLDIQMAAMDGMEAAYEIRKKNREAMIVFITSTVVYAPDGYRVGALRYIMKEHLVDLLPECLDAVLAAGKDSGKKRVTFPFVGGDRAVEPDKVLYIESRSHKLSVIMEGERPEMYGKLSDLEKKLSSRGFVRTHQSFLVNVEYIERIKNYQAELTDGSCIPVTKKRYAEVKEKFLQYKQRL